MGFLIKSSECGVRSVAIINQLYRWGNWGTEKLSNFVKVRWVTNRRARILPCWIFLSFHSARAIEWTQEDDLAARTPAHRLHLQGEARGVSSSNRIMVLSLLVALCGSALQSSKVRIRPSLEILALALEFGWSEIVSSLISDMIKAEKIWNLDLHACFFTSVFMNGAPSLCVIRVQGLNLEIADAWPDSSLSPAQIHLLSPLPGFYQFKHSDVAGFHGVFGKISPQGLILEKLNFLSNICYTAFHKWYISDILDTKQNYTYY